MKTCRTWSLLEHFGCALVAGACFVACGDDGTVSPSQGSSSHGSSTRGSASSMGTATPNSPIQADSEDTPTQEAEAPPDPSAATGEAVPTTPLDYAPAGPRPGLGDFGTQWVELQRVVETTITTSSNYRDDESQVAKLTDGDFDTAWNSATMEEGDTTPQSITITLPDNVTVHAIGITPGYTKKAEAGARDLFESNRRITKVRIRHGDDIVEGEIMSDVAALQDVAVEGNGGEWVIELSEWEQGTRADWREMVVSELRVWGEVGEGVPTRAPPPTAADMRRHADELLRRYIRSLGSGADLQYEGRELVGEPVTRTFWYRDEDAGETPRIPISLPAGRCYAIVGFVERRFNGREGDDPSFSFAEAGILDEWNRLEAGTATGTFALGLEPLICARDRAIQAPLETFDSQLIRFTLAIFEQGNDPEAREQQILEAIRNGAEVDDVTGEIMAPARIPHRDGLHLTTLTLTGNVMGREPGPTQQIYSRGAGEKAYCYFVLENPSREATQLQLAWLDENGESRSEPTLIDVPAQRRFMHYRYTNIDNRRPGKYACVLHEAGDELGRIEMRVTDE